MKVWLLVALLAVASTSASAQQIDRIEILNFGIYSGKITAHQDLAGTAAGINDVVDRKLVTQTETIPGRVGTRFGIQYVLRGRPLKKDVTLTCITRFPSPGVVNAKGEHLDKSEFSCGGVIGEKAIRTYTLDNSWEVVPGVWALEFYYDGRKIGEKMFNVVVQ